MASTARKQSIIAPSSTTTEFCALDPAVKEGLAEETYYRPEDDERRQHNPTVPR
jgi:hypothetical protein